MTVRGEASPRKPNTEKLGELSFLSDGSVELKLSGAIAKDRWVMYRILIDKYFEEVLK